MRNVAIIETPAQPRSPAEKELFTDLLAELRNPQSVGQPVIAIRTMPRGGLRHVHVIWDRWEGCLQENRAEIIREAFKAARGKAYEQSLAIAVGATVPEAAEIGLLPFEVKPYKWYKLEGAHTKSRTLDPLWRRVGWPCHHSPRPIAAVALPFRRIRNWPRS